MEFFKDAKIVRLKSHHDKYLLADSDQDSVSQDRHGSKKNARWTVEFVEYFDNVVRLKSCYNKYLTAREDQHLLGLTGRKVNQSIPKKLDSSIEWEPIREGVQVRLKTRYGNYLRANGGVPPWRNSITHDIPHRHRDWILWEVQVLERRPEPDPPIKIPRSQSVDDGLASSGLESSGLEIESSSFKLVSSKSAKSEDLLRKFPGRMIYYHVADDDGNFDNTTEGSSFNFKGHGLEELTEKLEEETGVEDIIVCSVNKVNGKLYPLRLGLPPNNATMHIVVVPAASKVAADFITPAVP